MTEAGKHAHHVNACFVEIFPAAYGDCFLVRYINGSRPVNILIDAGLAHTYHSVLKKRLLQLSSQGESLDLFVITHIDSDHIGGALALLKENGNAEHPQVIKIEEVWHNSFRHLGNVSAIAPLLRPYQEAILRDLESKGYPVERSGATDDERAISAKQGSSLASMLLKGGYGWNTSFGTGPVSCERPTPCFAREGLSITLLSPNKAKLDRLHSYWRAELSRLGFGKAVDGPFDDAFEFLAASERANATDLERNISASKPSIDDLLNSPFVEDESVTNGSSIAFALDVGGRHMLFLGDGHPSLILQQLTAFDPVAQLEWDLVKIAHHGSRANTSPELLQRMRAARYVLSSNGERFGHPDAETVVRIAAAPWHKEVIFNYPGARATLLDDTQLKSAFDYSVLVGDGSAPVVINL